MAQNKPSLPLSDLEWDEYEEACLRIGFRETLIRAPAEAELARLRWKLGLFGDPQP